jgi:co-chaperonin GroES (HSP10)
METSKLINSKAGVQFAKKIKGIKPLKDYILVTEMSFEQRTLNSGIILLSDDGKTDGIRPRWARVFAVGPEQKEIKIGQWVLVEHGRWTRGSLVEIDGSEHTIRRVDSSAILLVTDDQPSGVDTISSAIHATAKSL